MYIFIIKDNQIYARTEGDGAAADYSLMTVDTVPEYPNDGEIYDLALVNGEVVWQLVPHLPSLQDQIDEIREELDQQKYAWKAGEAVVVGDRRYYNGNWYTCLQSHTTQADWTPDVVPALWEAEA